MFCNKRQVSLKIFLVSVFHCCSNSLRPRRLKKPFLVSPFGGTASLSCCPFIVLSTRGSVSGPLRQTLAEYSGPHPLCTGQSSAPASHLQKSNPPPSTWRSWRPCSLAPGLEGSSWVVAWAAWQGPANSPSILGQRGGEKESEWKFALGTQAQI